MDNFVNLHRHDGNSLFDGLDLAIRAADKAAKLGQPALSLTNHGVTFGLVDHWHYCRKAGVKPILGMEAYVTLTDEKPKERKAIGHMTILVKDLEGYRNLMRLVTASYSEERFYYKPLIPLAALIERRAGLIVLTGCPSSPLSRAIRTEPALADEVWRTLRDSFHGQLWAEVQPGERFRDVAPWIVEHASADGIPMVATFDSHYVDAEDKVVHDVLLKLKFLSGKGKGEEDPTYGYGYHILSRAEAAKLMREAYPSWNEKPFLDNTVLLAEQVESFDIEKPPTILPKLWDDPVQKLKGLALTGMIKLGLVSKPEYQDRIGEEMRVIEQLGYAEYFLVCQEVTEFARQNGILITPRGSVCGSLLAYVLGVTMVDPLVHGTMFERFLHDKKKSFPDVDLDVDSRSREKVLSWVMEKYKPYAVPIATVGRYSSKAVANDLAKVLEMSPHQTRRLKECTEDLKKKRVLMVEEKDLVPYSIVDELEDEHPGFKRMLMKLFSAPRYIGQHPGGVCFVPGDHTRWFAEIRAKERWMTGYTLTDLERIGLLKFDFLGLAATASISRACEQIVKRHGALFIGDQVLYPDIVKTDTFGFQHWLRAIPLKDQEVYKRFARGNTDGIFQYETPGARQILKEIEPDNFKELAASTALNRPGASAGIPRYVEGKVAGKTGGFFGLTYGVPVYQEQWAGLLRYLGFSWEETDTFNKALKGAVTMANLTDEKKGEPIAKKFVDELMKRGWPKEKAVTLAEQSRQYSFNMAHAVGYTLVAYWQMWLRVYYPLEFWTSMLNSEHFDEKRKRYEGAAVRDGLVVLPPHVNGSVEYTIEDNAIRVGLSSIKNVGAKAAASLVKNGPYVKATQVVEKNQKKSVNVKVLRALAEAGALEMRQDKWKDLAIRYNQQRVEDLAKSYWRMRDGQAQASDSAAG